MKEITVFKCEVCGTTYQERASAQACEGGHFGLTTSEYSKWKSLSHAAARAGYKAGIAKNPGTQAAFDAAVKALVEFEVLHRLHECMAYGNLQKPSDFYC